MENLAEKLNRDDDSVADWSDWESVNWDDDRKITNIMAETIENLLYALNEKLIQGPFFEGLRRSLDMELRVNNIDIDLAVLIKNAVDRFIEDTKLEQKNK